MTIREYLGALFWPWRAPVATVTTVNMHAEAAVMLREARRHLETVGWVKGSYRDRWGAVCLSQALTDVDGTKHGALVDIEARRIVQALAGATKGIPTWNDAPERTKEDVLTLLQACEQVEKELAS
jgi:hypothetical protein